MPRVLCNNTAVYGAAIAAYASVVPTPSLQVISGGQLNEGDVFRSVGVKRDGQANQRLHFQQNLAGAKSLDQQTEEVLRNVVRKEIALHMPEQTQSSMPSMAAYAPQHRLTGSSNADINNVDITVVVSSENDFSSPATEQQAVQIPSRVQTQEPAGFAVPETVMIMAQQQQPQQQQQQPGYPVNNGYCAPAQIDNNFVVQPRVVRNVAQQHPFPAQVSLTPVQMVMQAASVYAMVPSTQKPPVSPAGIDDESDMVVADPGNIAPAGQHGQNNDIGVQLEVREPCVKLEGGGVLHDVSKNDTVIMNGKTFRHLQRFAKRMKHGKNHGGMYKSNSNNMYNSSGPRRRKAVRLNSSASSITAPSSSTFSHWNRRRHRHREESGTATTTGSSSSYYSSGGTGTSYCRRSGRFGRHSGHGSSCSYRD